MQSEECCGGCVAVLEGIDEYKMISISQGLQADNGAHSGFEFPVGSWDSLNWADYKEEKTQTNPHPVLKSSETAPALCSTSTLACAKCKSAAEMGL